MTTTIRAYADGSTTPVLTMAGLPDGTTAGVSIPGGALAPGVHSITTTAQIDGQSESVPSNARSVPVPAPVPPPPVVVPLAGQWLDITPPNVLYAYKPLVNYGMQDIAGAKADQPKTIYVGSCGYGIQKSIDGGNTWVHVSTGRNGSKLGNGTEGSARNWSLAVDPTNSDVIYAIAGFGQAIGGGGLWKSINGGIDWDQLLDPATFNLTNDLTNVAIDPTNNLHVLVAGHSPWSSVAGTPLAGFSGLVESFDGGATWTTHAPQNWGVGPTVQFIGQDDAGNPSGSYWLVCSGQGTPANPAAPAAPTTGTFRTTDGGKTWSVVYPQGRSHAGGGSTLYRMAFGGLLLGLDNHIVVSLDNGRTWAEDNAPGGPDGFGSIRGDGQQCFAMLANGGDGTEPVSTPYHWLVRSETVGGKWTAFSPQTFRDGPMSMIYDPINKVLYTSQWGTGCWRLQR